ncbi:hypothetical protein VB774_17965 [Pseudanabaena galeata UHCC 0370]|uniref:Transposase n=1 Tax=Pseudanabaena galeata UHCC 0370 TaxID=3110310 RepID=A0ABU5TML8_9CYAN|nr:hypothetical protein [Pseudanabaena galeata]MEA5479510.1 hypothetical protein [Pseudanabaena galeata UHCC 0370]
MTGGTVKHSRISRNILSLLDTKLKIRTLKPLTMTYGYGFLIIGVAYTQMRWFLMGLYNLTASPKGLRPCVSPRLTPSQEVLPRNISYLTIALLNEL